jgi:hypothetical protein
MELAYIQEQYNALMDAEPVKSTHKPGADNDQKLFYLSTLIK